MPINEWIEVDFKGLDKQIRKLAKIKSEIETEIDRIMLRAALILEAEVKRVITQINSETYDPKKKRGDLIDTGTLKASIHSYVRKRFGVEGVVQTTMEYAPFLEFGTGKRGKANPHPEKPSWYQYGDSPGNKAYKYMHTAWENKKDEIIKYVNSELRKVMLK